MNIFSDYCTVGFFTWRQVAAGERGCWSPQSQFFPERQERILTCYNTSLYWKYHSVNFCIRFLRTFFAFQQFSVTSPATWAAHTPFTIYKCCSTLKALKKNKMCKLCWKATVHCWQDLCETGHRADLLVEVDQGLQTFLSTWGWSVIEAAFSSQLGLLLLQPLGHVALPASISWAWQSVCEVS